MTPARPPPYPADARPTLKMGKSRKKTSAGGLAEAPIRVSADPDPRPTYGDEDKRPYPTPICADPPEKSRQTSRTAREGLIAHLMIHPHRARPASYMGL